MSRPPAWASRARHTPLPPPPGPSEPPLPTARRMAGQVVRTALAVVRHAARTGRVRAPRSERRRRWKICKACDHYRPSDKRCGKATGCGCWLKRKIPLAGVRCPLDPPEWGPYQSAGSGGLDSQSR